MELAHDLESKSLEELESMQAKLRKALRGFCSHETREYYKNALEIINVEINDRVKEVLEGNSTNTL